MDKYNLYPYILSDKNKPKKKTELPFFKEIAWDFLKDLPLIDKNTKEFKITEGNEAIKVWIYKAIKIARYRYRIYNSDYGCEIDKLVGKKYTRGYTESEATRYIKEALSINPYITQINLIEAFFENDDLKMHVNVYTIYSRDGEAVDLVA